MGAQIMMYAWQTYGVVRSYAHSVAGARGMRFAHRLRQSRHRRRTPGNPHRQAHFGDCLPHPGNKHHRRRLRRSVFQVNIQISGISALLQCSDNI